MSSRWLDPVWSAVDNAGMARRSAIDVGYCVGEERLVEEARARGLHVVVVASQYLIFRGPLEPKC